MSKEIRVRFAPSPTGPLHIGGLKTALFNYLVAKKQKGSFILRIEDTDRTRYVPGAEEYIVEALSWCGLSPDEGPGVGGEYGPYRQSERKEIYSSYASNLIESGSAYYAFDTPGEMDAIRKSFEARGETFTYDSYNRGELRNSLTMEPDMVGKMISDGTAYVIRFKFAPEEEIVMNDQIRGEVSVNSSTLDDKVLFKSDGMPTYHLANVVDDYLMKISHVIRGEEWLPSLPLHVALYQALGWKESMPEFVHLPLILKPAGKGKLSKRDGDKGGFPVFPLEWKDPVSGEISPGYREEGYLPGALINLLALMGWNPGTEQEVFSLEELITEFQIEKVGKSGSKFDPDKASWFNHQYIQKIPNDGLVDLFTPVLDANSIDWNREKVLAVIALMKPRINFVHELWDQSWFFFRPPSEYDPGIIRKRWKEETPAKMEMLIEALKACEPFTAERVEKVVKDLITDKEWGMGEVMNTWRLLLVGGASGPGLFNLAAIIGINEVTARMENGIKMIKP